MAYNPSAGKEPIKIDDDLFDDVSLAGILTTFVCGGVILGGANLVIDLLNGPNYTIPILQYSVDKIFAGKIPAFDINFINPKDWGDSDKNDLSITSKISSTISQWYNALRNIAIVGLLSVLLYTGIRILISSAADDKAKYKQRLFDWFIAMCLLFFMHYIMAGIIGLIEIINDTIGADMSSIPVQILKDGSPVLEFNTDLMGLIRLQMQYKDIGAKTTYFVLYIALLVYTCKYTWVYMKRTITMAFLTIIAPLVAMTYPIDKMNDGKAQAFSAWMKEYIFTALLQPFHLIIYTVLVGSVAMLAANNPIYAIMVIAFMGPAEKMLRKFFGFDKASTPGTLSSAGAMFGGAAAYNLFKKSVGAISNAKATASASGGGNVRTIGNQVEDPNAPNGYQAFANNNNSQVTTDNSSSLENNSLENNTNEQTAQQRMLEAYDENYGTDAYDNTEREAMAREAYQPESPEMSAEELAKWLKEEQGWDDDSINKYLRDNGYIDDSTLTPQEKEKLQELEKLDKERKEKIKNAIKPPVWKKAESWTRRNLGTEEARKVTAEKALKAAGRLAGKATVAGVTGAVGLGMGIAGDDLEDVLKYGAAGTALGASVAPAIGRRIANSETGQSISRASGRMLYGSDEMADVIRERQRIISSGEMRQEVMSNYYDSNGNRYSGKQLDDMEQRLIDHRLAGISDPSDRKKTIKLEDKMRKELEQNLPESERNNEEKLQERNDKAKVMAQTIAKMAKGVEPGKLSNKEYVNGKLEEFEKGIKNANPELSNREVSANAKQMMNYVKDYYKTPR